MSSTYVIDNDNEPLWKRPKRSSGEMMTSEITTGTGSTSNHIPSPTTLGLSSNVMKSSHTTHITMIHQQHQIDTLRMQMEHERDKYKLECKKLHHTIEKVTQQLEMSQKELHQLNELYNDSQTNYEKQLNDVTSAHQKSLQQNRQLQLQMEERQRYNYGVHSQRCTRSSTKDTNDDGGVRIDDHSDNGDTTIDEMIDTELQSYQILNQQLQQQIQNYTQNESTYQQEIDTLKALVHEKLQTIQSEKNQVEEKSYEEAPKTLLQELNACRIQLATAERKIRQYERQTLYEQTQYKTLLKENESFKLQQYKYQMIEKELQTLQQRYTQIESDHVAYTDFTKQVYQIMNTNNNNSYSNNNINITTQRGPPDLATIVRFLSDMKRQQQSVLLEGTTTTITSNESKSFLPLPPVHDEDNENNIEQKTINEWIKKCRDYEIEVQTLQRKNNVTNHQLQLYQREMNSYKALIHTYDEQQMMLLSPSKKTMEYGTTSITTTSSSTDNNNMNVEYDTLMIEYRSIKELYEQLQKSNDTVVSELYTCQMERNTIQSDYDQLKIKYQRIRDAMQLEKDRRTAMEQQLIIAEQLAGKGSFNSEQTRILHLTETPLVQALKEEITVLKRQVEALVQQHQKSMTITSPSGMNALDTSMLLLSSSTNTSSTTTSMPNPEKVIQRLKEQFKEQIGLFREGVYIMTGYKIDMITTATAGSSTTVTASPEDSTKFRPTFRLRSVFAEKEEDQILLQWPSNHNNNNKNKSLDILQTDFAKYLMTTPSYEYVSKLHNIPAFLASVQLMLFEKQTIMM